MDDFDIEMGDVADVPMEEHEVAEIPLGDDPQEDGEVEEDHPSGHNAESDDARLVLNKIHIRGLDTVNETSLKEFVASHVGATLQRVEWVDDTSANLVFGSDASAQEALIALSAVEIADATQLPPLELLPTKDFTPKPEVGLRIRFAVETDRKVKNAAERSRFYLMNPEEEEKARRRWQRESRYRSRDDDRGYGRDRDRRSGRGRRNDRYDDEEPEKFDVSLYDDDEEALAKRGEGRLARRRDSRSPSDRSDYESRKVRNSGKELFPDRRPRERDYNGTRNRSASPLRDEIADDLEKDRIANRNRDQARSIRDRLSKDNSTKELFPSKASNANKAQMDQVAGEPTTGRLLSDQITDPNNGINIRGIAEKRGANQGFSIKGASVKELFPEKFNSNAGKELFSEKLEGRGRRRQRADDFH